MSSEPWPFDGLAAAVQEKLDESRSLALFKSLRRCILASEEEELVRVADKAAITWSFLLAFGAEQPSLNRQVSECVSVLMSSERWERVAQQPDLQAKVQDLPEDLQTAFAAQHETLMKSFSADAMKKMRQKVVPEELRKTEVDSGVRAYKEADKLRSGMIEDSADDVRNVPVFPGRGHGAQQDSVRSELHESIEAVLLIDNPVKFENAAISVFGQLRRGCLHAMCVPEVFDNEAESAPAVFHFLIDFAKKNRIRLKQISEVLNILMASPAWAESFNASPMLKQRVQSELSDSVQAVFGLQHEQLMEAVSDTARRRAVSEQSNPDIKDAQEVAEKMRSMRSGLQVQFLDSVHELHFGGMEQLTRARRAADAVVSAAERVHEAVTADEWREATTPEGKKYYYSVRTRESRWERPKITKAANLSAHGFHVGDSVEVYSNSGKVWCAGIVEKIAEHTVTIAFQLPNAKPNEWATKELPLSHKDLRKPEQAMGSTSLLLAAKQLTWLPEERAAYEQFYEGLIQNGTVDPQVIPQFLSSSGLPRRSLREIWGVANPELRPTLSLDEFCLSCRLVGHCQAMRDDEAKSRLLTQGGQPLAALLKGRCMGVPPQSPPVFESFKASKE